MKLHELAPAPVYQRVKRKGRASVPATAKRADAAIRGRRPVPAGASVSFLRRTDAAYTAPSKRGFTNISLKLIRQSISRFQRVRGWAGCRWDCI
jgi:hypothetical protein